MPLKKGNPRRGGKDTRTARVQLGLMLPFGVAFCSCEGQTGGETHCILANM